MGTSTDRLLDLRPVTFRYTADPPEAPRHYGLIAEEVARLYPDLVLRDRNGTISGVRYEELSSMLLNELQKDRARADQQAARIDALAAEIRSIRETQTSERAVDPAREKDR
jgi:hypothetical protein